MKKLRKLIRLIKFNRKARSITIILVIVVLLSISTTISLVSILKSKSTTAAASDISSDSDYTYITPSPDKKEDITDAPEPVIDKEVTSFKPATKMDLDPSSITVYVNREYALPKDYKPDHLVTPNIRFNLQTYDERTMMRSDAAKAIERLFAAAEKQGLYLVGVSGYRSYDRQYKIFTNNLVTKGKEHTLEYSAIPGTSEHQTGLVMDCSTESMKYDLSDKFYDTPEGKWLAKNSYKYGFIIRYPKDKADITGYAYEPWHIRYVGRGLSYYLYEHKLTLDEYYKYTPSPDFDFEKVYADILNYVPPTKAATATPTPTPTVSPTPPAGEDTQKDNKGNKDTHKGDNTGKTSGIATPVPTPPSDSGKKPTITSIPENNDGSDTSTDTEDSSSDNTDTSNETANDIIQ